MSKWLAVVALLGLAVTGQCGGPRFVSGAAYARDNQWMVWAQTQLTYATDPGDLATTVSHARADAMVAAAAGVWNVDVANITLGQNGTLAEHVSAANVTLGANGVEFPADVMASNAASIPVAVIYDTDGSVTNLLLGDGASDPAECRRNSVTESVDAFTYTAKIQHAVIVLNGRCVGKSDEQLTEMQYHLMRAFGRVLGLAWSQVNDNVFTGARPFTAQQMANWPVMHPIDVLCGPYAYQCMQNPFQLREDDIAALTLLYPVPQAVPQGKRWSLEHAISVRGDLVFPTGQGMEMVNVTVVRQNAGGIPPETWQCASGVTGTVFREDIGNVVTGVVAAGEQSGTPWSEGESQYNIGRLNVASGVADFTMTTESVNPLYEGEWAIAPFTGQPLAVSGGAQTVAQSVHEGYQVLPATMTASGGATTCAPGTDGAESSPSAANASGWWSGQLCSTGHTSWWSVSARAGRSWTMEVTALDENGAAAESKAQLVLGAWKATDAVGTLPTVAASQSVFNTSAVGVTGIQAQSASADTTYRVAVEDVYGRGRPDMTYRARFLYADSVSPLTMAANGGTLTIAGAGFRAGNVVKVGAVTAKVTSVSATSLTVQVPAMLTTGAVDVEVDDHGTGGRTVISNALTITQAVQAGTLSVKSAPVYAAAGSAFGPWTVAVSAVMNSAAGVGVPVTWSATGSVTLSATQSVSDASGSATVTVSAAQLSAGAATVTGCAWTNVCTAWTLTGVDASQWQVAVTGGGAQSVATVSAVAPVSLQVTDASGHALMGASVTGYQTVYAGVPSCTAQGRCAEQAVLAKGSSSAVSDATGAVTVTPITVTGGAETVKVLAVTGASGSTTAQIVVQ